MTTHPSLVSLTRAVGAVCALVALLSPSFGCTPVPFTPGAESPFARAVKPEDLYVEEAEGPLKIGQGDELEVVVRRGAGEERSTVTVRDNGRIYVGAVDVEVGDRTIPDAEARIAEQLTTIIRNPRVEVTIKKKKLERHKERIYIIGGGVGRGSGLGTGAGTGEFLTGGAAGGIGGFIGFADLDRKTTVGQLIASVGYNGFAVLDDIRVIRGDSRKPEVIPVDIQRLYQYGDRSQDIMLKNNDIVFVPRQRIGDWNAFLEKINPTLNLLLGSATLSPEALVKFLSNNNIQPVLVPTINVR